MSLFLIQTNSNVPIYRQLVEQVQRLVTSGRLSEGEQLPSVRQLAEELAVNPMTISKAYSQLEQEGILVRKRGIGMAVATATGSSTDLIAEAVNEVVNQALQLGMDKRTLNSHINETWARLTEGKD